MSFPAAAGIYFASAALTLARSSLVALSDYVVCVLKLATMIMGCCFYPFIFEVWKAINHPFGWIPKMNNEKDLYRTFEGEVS